ncbi:ABC transporter ATP-binding protein [Microbacterium sp. EYE_5]|uniref:dipeptide ABC transporter ATP-binding protein n=1 Tax=unclassified Microbacterium TaxID=2609290 RepID=UPI00249ED7D9|nr:ABC transporter ATP-binding protein [Microbacterium sp. EYE_382]MCK6084629.1 ABC transporter ATP-binding protein [Microbacterium sp. EYE_384]MCK6123142.1 ABC transporter ATP-binding protein [Microbacterium sp. EYE_80]MCK6125393.1 ABC transporter ATP-binding protein [Microbacterium sp. EYE_79]MCK6140313.1 ABC transporter ATP-binding protein [Microbacterium sp. EYE_39]MCK6217040.1 ABC transporter ATP-binding protein [Microbacterium sp. EYE_5]MCK6227473.1 ABC transporter ATP-binding protein [
MSTPSSAEESPVSTTTAAPRAEASVPSRTERAVLLEVRDLTVAYRMGDREVEAVHHIDLTIGAGEVVAVVGESGSGKSTIAHAIINLLPPNARVTSGSVSLGGDDLTAKPEAQWRKVRGKRIGLVPQDPSLSLNPVRRVGPQVAEPLRIHKLATRAEANARAVELLEMAGITHPAERAKQYPYQFSGGMRQRALIATALAARPELIIADEPTSALDVTVQKQVLDHLDHLADEFGTSVLLITHDLGVAADRADRIIVMKDGAVVDAGPAAQVISSPTAEYTRQLIAASPDISSHVRRAAATARRGLDDSDCIVRLSHLVKTFPLPASSRRDGAREVTAVDDISLDIRRGETLAVVGESGSGKSTLARLVLRLEEPSSGSIEFDGADITELAPAPLRQLRRKFQLVYQSPYDSLNPRLTIEQLISEPLHSLASLDGTARLRKVRELVEQTALPQGVLARYPDELSGGQRQRVAIARALALDPEFLVLDEAVSALDVSVQAQILDLLITLQAERSLSYLFITHDLGVVAEIADRVAVMRHGRLVEAGTAAQILTAPTDPYTQALIAAIPGQGRHVRRKGASV